MVMFMAYSACPSWRSAFSFPDDRQASDRSPTNAMAVPASSWTKDLCTSYEPSAPLLVPQIPHSVVEIVVAIRTPVPMRRSGLDLSSTSRCRRQVNAGSASRLDSRCARRYSNQVSSNGFGPARWHAEGTPALEANRPRQQPAAGAGSQTAKVKAGRRVPGPPASAGIAWAPQHGLTPRRPDQPFEAPQG